MTCEVKCSIRVDHIRFTIFIVTQYPQTGFSWDNHWSIRLIDGLDERKIGISYMIEHRKIRIFGLEDEISVFW